MNRFRPRRVAKELSGPYVEMASQGDEDKEVLDIGEVDRLLQVSDPHLGHKDAHNPDAYYDLLNEEVSRFDPDVVVVSGDFLEFWRSSIENVFLRHQREINQTLGLADESTDVVLIAGNHDYRILKFQGGVEVVNHLLFQSGDREFRVLHGQEYDPKNANNYTNEALCLTSEDTGEAMDDIWNIWKYISGNPLLANRVEFGLPGAISPTGQIQHVSDPDALAKPESSGRRNLIEDAVEADNEEFVLYGHTHYPTRGTESVNAGSFTGSEHTYVTVDDGDVELNTW